MSIIASTPNLVHARLAEADRIGLDDDEPRPTYDERYTPDPEDEARWLGYSMALEGEMAESDSVQAHWNALERSAFRIGQSIGLLERHRLEDMEREARMLQAELEEAAFGPDRHPDEAIRSLGCIEARRA